MKEFNKIIKRLFEPSQPRALALDISDSGVKLLEFQYKHGIYTVERFAIVPFEDEAIQGHTIKDKDKVVEAIQTALFKAKTKTKYAMIALMGSSIITKTIRLATGFSGREFEEQVYIEADRHIPFPIEEVSLDFSVLDQKQEPQEPFENNEEATESFVDVLLVASRNDNLDGRVSVVKSAGLKVSLVDVDFYAMQRATQLIVEKLTQQGKDQVVAIIDIGAFTTNLIVMYNFSIVYSREETFGSEYLLDQLKKHFDLTAEEIELLKKNEPLPEREAEDAAMYLIHLQSELLQHIRRPLQFFLATNEHDQIDNILLMGGGSCIPGLADYLQDKLEISTILANPFDEMLISNKVDAKALHQAAPILMVCSGLAMRGSQQ